MFSVDNAGNLLPTDTAPYRKGVWLSEGEDNIDLAFQYLWEHAMTRKVEVQKNSVAVDSVQEGKESRDMSRRGFLATTGALVASSVFAGRVFASDNDTIRIGFISSMTGALALFGESDTFVIEQVRKTLANGLDIAGKHYKVEILQRDDQTSADRAASLTSQLINGDKIDLMLAPGAIGVINIAQQCELNGVPCITTMTPWQAWMYPLKGSPEKGFKYIHHFFWGTEDIAAVYEDIWRSLPVKKVIASGWPNTVPGNAMGSPKIGLPATWMKDGYQIVDTGRFEAGAADFTLQIQAYKKAGADIVSGLYAPTEWSTFWRQAQQLGYHPKVATIAVAFLFPSGVKAMGKAADGMSTEIWWSPSYPFKSTLTGQSAQQLADSYRETTKRDWTQPLGVVHALWELGINVLKTSGDPKNPEKVSATIARTDLQTVIGRISWPASSIKSVAKMRVVGGQWRILPDHPEAQLFITNNATAPEIPVQRKFELLGTS